ncbi:AzlD domain-containing protein [Rhodoferax sp.]|uniref:AzlD domain-containing protein n=1 Tax=Rhodoferax sp. TaxID=50421 RepID=UPI0025EAD123|nr:AzlD domain-containing protein [Rhodoferax sp.]
MTWLDGRTDGWTLLTILGLACITVLARSFFFILDRNWALPPWAQRGLQYAPIAALAAVIVPEIVMLQGQLIHTLKDARLYAVVAGLGYFFWRHGKGQAVLGTIMSGMAVYLPLHIGWGW